MQADARPSLHVDKRALQKPLEEAHSLLHGQRNELMQMHAASKQMQLRKGSGCNAAARLCSAPQLLARCSPHVPARTPAASC
jgi:hypothetical protein